MSVTSIINDIKNAQSNLTNQARVFLEEDKNKILDYVRIDQLFELGEDADGIKLEAYTPFTRAVKISEGRNPNIVTLFDEGDYYRGFDFTLIGESTLNIFSRDIKAKELSDKYGVRIDDLSDSNEQKVNTKLEDQLITWVLGSVKI